MSGDCLEADAPHLGADESMGRLPNSDSTSANAPHGDNADPQGLPGARRRAPMQRLRWNGNDVAKLLALFVKYQGDKRCPSKVHADWEVLRAAGELENCVVRSEKALQHVYRRFGPRGNENIDDLRTETVAETPEVVPPDAVQLEASQESVTEVEEVSQGEDTDPRRSDEYIAFKESHWAEVVSEFKRACKAKGMERPALPKPKKRIPTEFQHLGDALVCDLLEPHGESASFEKLTCAVYASGKVILAHMRGNQVAQKSTADQVQKNRVERSKSLSKFLAWTQEEINRRESGTAINERQSYQLKRLRDEFTRLRQLPDFRQLKETLTCKLRIVNRQIQSRDDEVERRRIRGLPLKRALERTENSKKDKIIPINRVRGFWAGIIGQSKEFKQCPELDEWKNSLQSDSPQAIALEGSAGDWEAVCKKAKSWKAPGPDGIPAGIWKAFPTARAMLHKWVIKWIHGEKRIPPWFMKGRAILLYKKGDRLDPGNYRTICCLNTSYKLVTALITRWLQVRLTEIGALPQEQLAVKKDIWACCEAHFLDATVTSDALCRCKRRPNSEVLNMAWIDFAKAFDSIPHSYVRWVLKAVGLDERVRHFLHKLMNGWNIQYEQYSGPKCQKSRPLKVVNGVLQGDALSPLLYCICIAPLSHWLNKHIPKYVTAHGSRGRDRQTTSLNHLYYMDDLKIYTPKSEDLIRAVEGVNRISGNIGCRINVNKSAMACVAGASVQITPVQGVLSEFPVLGVKDMYKYLGIEQNVRIGQEDLWERVSDAICRKTRSIFSSKLSTRQMVNGFNVTIPAIVRFVGMCSVIGKGAFNQQRSAMEKLDGKVREILAECRVRFRWQSCHRLYAAPSNGGLGIRRISDVFEESIVYSYSYLACSPSLSTVQHFLRGSSTQRNVTTDFEQIMKLYGIHAASTDQQIVVTPGKLGITVDGEEICTATKAARTIIKLIKAKREEEQSRKLGIGTDSGRAEPGFKMAAMTNDYERWGIDKNHAWSWLKKGVMGPKVVRNIMAAQDNQLLAGYHRNKRKRCRFACNKQNPPEENVAHIVSGCEHWSANLYTERHNMVANDIYHALCRKYDLPRSRYQSRVNDVQENERAKLYWNKSVEAAVQVKHNQPDIVCFEKDAATGKITRIWIVEIAVAWYQGLREKERQKYHRYAVNSQSDSSHPDVNLQTELGKMYGCRVETIPVVVGVFGEVSVNLTRYLRQLDLEDDVWWLVERIQRSAVLGTHWVIKAHMSVAHT